MGFQALELGLSAISLLRSPVDTIRRRDDSLSSQIRRAANSIPLNLGEGSRRVGKDSAHFFRIAAGSAEEVRTALRVAIAWGYITGESVAEVLDRIDHVVAILYKLTR